MSDHTERRNSGWTEHGQVADYGVLGMDFYGAKDCDRCSGFGSLMRHDESGTLALWPGGPLRGREVPA